MATVTTESPPRPTDRGGFEIAVICALTLEADAVEALFDVHWDDDGPPFDKAPGDPNAYSAGSVGRHNVVLAHMPGMGKTNAAIVANNCRTSFPNIKLALLVGVCGVVPFGPDGEEIILGDVIISDGVIQYDLGRQLPGRFVRKDTLLDLLGRPNTEIRAVLAKLKGLRSRTLFGKNMAGYLDTLRLEPQLAAEYPGATHDNLFEATYHHIGDKQSCEQVGCNGTLVPRRRLQASGNPEPAVHFGLVASGDSVMKSGEDRDAMAQEEGVIAFEMEGAGIWDTFPCVVVKGACDYADSHKSKRWQRYAAATAAAGMKAFLRTWVPSPALISTEEDGPSVRHLIPYTSNPDFVGRERILETLRNQLGHIHKTNSTSQARVALFGLGGIGKTQIALAYVYWLLETYAAVSIFWVHASNAERFRQSYASIAQECRIPGFTDPDVDMLLLVKSWLTRPGHGRWLMVIDNADDAQVFFGQPADATTTSMNRSEGEKLSSYLPECAHGTILITTRNKQAGSRLTKGQPLIEVPRMEEDNSKQLLRARLKGISTTSVALSMLSSKLEHLPLALAQSAAFIHETSITVDEYIELMGQNDKDLVDLLSKEFETVGRDSEAHQAVAQTWILSFRQIQQQHLLASQLLSLMSIFDRQDIPMQFLSHYGREQNGVRYNAIEITEALGILKGFSFVTEGKSGSFDMHRLVQLVTQKWLVSSDTMGRFWGEALLTLSDLYPDGTFENRTVCTAYLSHVNAVLRSGEATSREKCEAKASLLHRVASYFILEGKWSDAEKLNNEAITIRKEYLHVHHPATLASMANLASIYWSQGRLDEAEKLNVQVTEMSKLKLGADHPSTLVSMANLASTYRNQGRWEEAEKLNIQVMEIRRVKLGADHLDTLTSMANLASIYRNQGRLEEAEKLEVRVMEIHRVKLGADHPDTLISMANLATTYMNQGRWEEAEKLNIQVMEIRRVKLGADHLDTLTSMANLASIYRNQGRLEEAEKLGVRVMEIHRVKLGADHPDTLISMANLASTYWNQGRLEEAEKLEVRVMEIHRVKLGADHPDTLISMANLANTWKCMGRTSEAVDLMRICIRLQQVKLGLHHPDTQTSISNLADWEDRK